MTAAEPSLDISLANPVSSASFDFEARGNDVRPLKIALLGYRSHPHVGGQGIYLKYLSRALHQLGHDVDVISGPPYPELDDGIGLIKVPSLDLFAKESHIKALRWKHLRSFTDTFEWWSMASGGFAEPYTFGRRVNKILCESNYDIIHDNQSLCFGLLKLQKAGHTVVSTIHHPIHRDRQLALDAAPRWGDRLLVKRWYSFLNMQEKVVKDLRHIITVSETSQQDIALHFQRNKEDTPVIFNGIDTDSFRPLSIKKIPNQIITTSSSDQPLKGLQFLLEAVSQLRKDIPDIHLRVIGKLKEGGSTENQLKQLNLGSHVSFVSGISTRELVQEYNQSQLAVCPSLYEGFGLPAGEAMACELPVISSNGGALPEVVGDAGIIVEKANAKALAKNIKQLLINPLKAQALGKLARKRIVNTFSWQQVALTLSHYYERAINNANH